MGLIHPYGSLGVPQASKSYNPLIAYRGVTGGGAGRGIASPPFGRIEGTADNKIILGKGFAQAVVYTVHSTHAFGTCAINSVSTCA